MHVTYTLINISASDEVYASITRNPSPLHPLQVICFDQLVMGSSNTIEHYRAGAPFFNWTMFRQMGDLLLQHLPTGKLGEELDSECKYRVTVLDRQGTRQILNAQELADALKQVLFCCEDARSV